MCRSPAQRLPAARPKTPRAARARGQPRRVTLYLLSPWAPPPMEKAIFARGSSGTSRPHGGKFENHAKVGEILAERREEGSDREGTGRRMLAAATAAYGYFNPALLPTPHSPPASSRLPDLARSAPVASQFGSSHTS
jgi:hypothetical protein